MHELYEFRIDNNYASLLFTEDEGIRSGDIRKITLPASDPRFSQIGKLQAELRAKQGKPFFYGWDIHRHYSKRELDSAKLFRLEITAVFEPAGEECGTNYHYENACPHCGAGREQVGELVLDLRKVPKNKEIAKTIADEWVVSQQLAAHLVDAKVTGFELRPVRHKARHEDDAIDLRKGRSGRTLLEMAEAAGAPYPTWPFWVWLNRPEQAALYQATKQEHADMMLKREKSRAVRQFPIWYQLIVKSRPLPVVTPTRFGIDPFDEDQEGRYRCPLGHVSGLNVLSEVSVLRAAWDGSDVACTEDQVGLRRGLLVPAPLLLISPRLRQLLLENKMTGFEVEVAHLL